MTEIDLDALHAAIVAAIVEGMPSLAFVASYPEVRTAVALPAVLVDLEDMEAVPDLDPGTEQLAVNLRWRARLILGFTSPDLQRQIRKGAAQLGRLIHLNRFGMPVGPARVSVIAPDAFDPDLDQYEVWGVEWEQTAHLGASVWDGVGIVPETVFLGLSPDTGPGNEDKYVQIKPVL
jgi:hypothetical protein